MYLYLNYTPGVYVRGLANYPWVIQEDDEYLCNESYTFFGIIPDWAQ